MMTNINRTMVLNSLIKHETVTVDDMRKQEHPGFVPDNIHLDYLLNELVESRHIDTLNGVSPLTYTVTSKGIEEGERLSKKVEN